MKKQTGFTLIELFIAVAVLSVLITLVVPEMRRTLQSNQITSKTNALVRTLNYARNESVVKGSSAVLRIEAISGSKEWGDGWMLSLERGGVSEELKRFEFDNGILVTANGNISEIAYSRGQVNLPNPLLLTICHTDSQSNLPGRRIEVEYTGRVSLRDRHFDCSSQ
jgi:type IV fimbrial biogenesis protein FimT